MSYPYAATRAFSVGFMLLALGCGRKDGATTGETTSGAATSAAVRVADVKLGRALGADKRLTDETDDFRPGDTIYAVVETRGTGPNTSLQARWTYQDGQVVNEESRDLQLTGDGTTEFHISKPDGFPTGSYKVEVSLDGNVVQTKEFEVR